MSSSRRTLIIVSLSVLVVTIVVLVSIVALTANRLSRNPVLQGLSLAVGLAALACTGAVWRLTLTHVRAAEEKVQLALTDAETGLRNERAFEDTMRAQVASAIRYELVISLALFNIVGVKGQPIGGLKHKEFAALLDEGREGDMPFRLQENVYALLLPYATSKAARTAVERLLHAIPQRIPHVTVQVGIATGAGNEANTLMQHAETALSKTRESEGDTVIISDTPDTALADPA
jgi:GGDEF domain-containing protein